MEDSQQKVKRAKKQKDVISERGVGKSSWAETFTRVKCIPGKHTLARNPVLGPRYRAGTVIDGHSTVSTSGRFSAPSMMTTRIWSIVPSYRQREGMSGTEPARRRAGMQQNIGGQLGLKGGASSLTLIGGRGGERKRAGGWGRLAWQRTKVRAPLSDFGPLVRSQLPGRPAQLEVQLASRSDAQRHVATSGRFRCHVY
ncbi:unnamed protein product [Calypogeia fissa]